MPIEFQRKTINFPAQTGGPRKGKVRATFSNAIVHVDAAISCFDMEFSDGDCHLFQQKVDVSVAIDPKELNVAEVTVKFALRDSSGDFDDTYSGYVETLLIAETQEFVILPYIQGDNTVALRASNGMYLSAEPGAGGKLAATKKTIGDNERFNVIIVDNVASGTLADLSQLALRANNGRLVCAENGGGQELVANRDQLGPWETFVIRRIGASEAPRLAGLVDGDNVALRAYSGQFVCAGGDDQVIAKQFCVTQRETFSIVKVS